MLLPGKLLLYIQYQQRKLHGHMMWLCSQIPLKITYLFINLSKEQVLNIMLMDMSGKVISLLNTNKNTEQIQMFLDGVLNGVYTLFLETNQRYSDKENIKTR